MPGKADFQRAFGLQKKRLAEVGLVVTGSISVGHIPVRKWELYHYPIRFDCSASFGTSAARTTHDDPNARSDAVKARFCAHTTGERIVYSQYGNPYRCLVKDVLIQARGGGQWTVTALGTGHKDNSDAKVAKGHKADQASPSERSPMCPTTYSQPPPTDGGATPADAIKLLFEPGTRKISDFFCREDVRPEH